MTVKVLERKCKKSSHKTLDLLCNSTHRFAGRWMLEGFEYDRFPDDGSVLVKLKWTDERSRFAMSDTGKRWTMYGKIELPDRVRLWWFSLFAKEVKKDGRECPLCDGTGFDDPTCGSAGTPAGPCGMCKGTGRTHEGELTT